MSETKTTVVLAAGGTGGHIFPAESLAELLLQKGHDVILVTDKRYKRRESTPEAMQIKTISSASTGGGIVRKAFAVIAIIMGILQSRKILKSVKPEYAVGFGGYPSFPLMIAAISLGLKTILHEQNAVMGRVNRIIAPHATKIATSFPEVSHIKEADRKKITFTGNPVRPAIKALHGLPYPEMNENESLHILLLGGSQGATIFSDVVPEALASLPKDLQSRIRLDQQCRPEDIERVKAIYKDTSVNADLASFFEDVPSRMASAHLIIARAGASTMAEIAVAGKPAILVPYKHAMDDHQTANAKSLENIGAAIVIAQDEFKPEILVEHLNKFINNSEVLKTMAESASKFGEVDAAENLLELVEE